MTQDVPSSTLATVYLKKKLTQPILSNNKHKYKKEEKLKQDASIQQTSTNNSQKRTWVSKGLLLVSFLEEVVNKLQEECLQHPEKIQARIFDGKKIV